MGKKRQSSGLSAAIDDGDLALVRQLLADGASPNEGDKGWCLPLIHAAMKGTSSMVKLLLEAGADVNGAEPPEQVTALMAAADNGHLKIVRLLLAAGADVNHATTSDITALWEAVHGRSAT